MTRITHFGPSAVVLLAAAATLFGGPAAIRSMLSEQTRVDVIQASNRLAEENVLVAFSNATRDIATIVEPSVVHVSTEGNLSSQRSTQRYASSGSGWIWDEQGHIVTNAHVVGGADRIEIQLHDGDTRTAELVGLDPRTDIAVLKIDSDNIIASRRGSSRDVKQGDLVFAFGSPFDFRFSMSSGIVSGLGRAAGLQDVDYENFIQVDAAINPGNSGGPLTDVYGRVVGMNTAIATGQNNTIGQGQFAGVGLAIPMTMIEAVVNQVIDTGIVRKGYLGVRLDPDWYARLQVEVNRSSSPSEDSLAILDAYDGEGVRISFVVEPDSAAARAGLKVGDVIERIDGQRVRGLEQLKAMISTGLPGKSIDILVWRWDPSVLEGRRINIELVLGELDNRQVSIGANFLDQQGLTSLVRSTPPRAKNSGVDYERGILVLESSPAGALGKILTPGSIITNAGGRSLDTPGELQAILDRILIRSRFSRRLEFPPGFTIEATVPGQGPVIIDLSQLGNSKAR